LHELLVALVADWRPTIKPGPSLLEQTVEGVARAGGWFVCPAGRNRFVRSKEVTEVRFLAIGNPFGLGLAAPVAHGWIVVETVQTAVKVGGATRALVGARNGRFKLYLLFAVMADHGSNWIIRDWQRIFHRIEG
jgi:hypothetical protein